MDFLDRAALTSLVTPSGISGRLATLALAWVAVATLSHLGACILLLWRFSREGPVIPALLPQLKAKWEAAMFKVGVWFWLRRIGLLILALSLPALLVESGATLHAILLAKVVRPEWRELLDHGLWRIWGVVTLVCAGLAIRIIFGGLASLLASRAANFVTASNSLTSPQEVERVRRFLDGLDRTPWDHGGKGR
jgi:hypothetical protein